MAMWDQSDRIRTAAIFERSAKRNDAKGNTVQAEKDRRVARWYKGGCVGELPRLP